jgi:hypothetical protein
VDYLREAGEGELQQKHGAEEAMSEHASRVRGAGCGARWGTAKDRQPINDLLGNHANQVLDNAADFCRRKW